MSRVRPLTHAMVAASVDPSSQTTTSIGSAQSCTIALRTARRISPGGVSRTGMITETAGRTAVSHDGGRPLRGTPRMLVSGHPAPSGGPGVIPSVPPVNMYP
ncbi:hypothetical protein [Pseudonocardia sp. GCM10023141]|uniref:hypothetical protein n=1 Tax=Pseudonocardia sp. GCM10023141 TaxID=3252653 RepID=UPI0036113AEC